MEASPAPSRKVVYSWGHGLHGQLGLGSTLSQPKPTGPLRLPGDIISVVAGGSISAAVTRGGALFMWGKGHHGTLGNGSHAPASSPRAVASIKGVQKVAVAENHCLALTNNGDVSFFGMGLSSGEQDCLAPKPVKLDCKAVDIAIGRQVRVCQVASFLLWPHSKLPLTHH
jgi:alpha-tubulin suppressor-like RCC1 family protein